MDPLRLEALAIHEQETAQVRVPQERRTEWLRAHVGSLYEDKAYNESSDER